METSSKDLEWERMVNEQRKMQTFLAIYSYINVVGLSHVSPCVLGIRLEWERMVNEKRKMQTLLAIYSWINVVGLSHVSPCVLGTRLVSIYVS